METVQDLIDLLAPHRDKPLEIWGPCVQMTLEEFWAGCVCEEKDTLFIGL